jgi:hypothetical protein
MRPIHQLQILGICIFSEIWLRERVDAKSIEELKPKELEQRRNET